MIDQILSLFDVIEDGIWTYVGIPALLILGFYLSMKSHWFQITKLPEIFSIFKSFMTKKEGDERGVHPIHAFFASVGGCVGVGNVISVCTAVQVGGPGAVFWIWVAALLGMLVKYGEIFLGVKFRQKDAQNSYVGGPMIYLQKVPGGAVLAKIVTVLMCLYGVEIYMFRVLTDTVSEGWGIDKVFIIPVLLLLVLGVGKGGVRLVGKVSTVVIPIFLVCFAGMSFWVFAYNIHMLPKIFVSIFSHAFTSHAAIGAFAGSSMMLAMSHGVRRACYTADIGVGYAATIHAETDETSSVKQATLGIIDILLDTFIVCTFSMLLILITGTWHGGGSEIYLVSNALAQYFPYVNVIWPVFIFLLGYSSLIAFFAAGRRAAMLLSPKIGSELFLLFAGSSFLFFSFFGKLSHCMSVMAIVGALLLVINLYGLFYLRDEISFDLKT